MFSLRDFRVRSWRFAIRLLYLDGQLALEDKSGKDGNEFRNGIFLKDLDTFDINFLFPSKLVGVHSNVFMTFFFAAICSRG